MRIFLLFFFLQNWPVLNRAGKSFQACIDVRCSYPELSKTVQVYGTELKNVTTEENKIELERYEAAYSAMKDMLTVWRLIIANANSDRIIIEARIVWEDMKGNNLFTSDPFSAKDEVRPLLPAYDIPITEDRVKHVPETNILLNGKKIKGQAIRTEVVKVFSGNTALRRILAVVNKNLKEP